MKALKLNDVYRFRYNQEEAKKRFDPYHCFDGLLVVKANDIGTFYLEDSYWMYGDNKTFTQAEALAKGSLEYICNREDVVPIRRCDMQYYADSDIFDLSTQHGCREHYVVRKGAVRCKEKMLRVVAGKIQDAERKIQQAQRDIACYTEVMQKIEAGDLSVYI